MIKSIKNYFSELLGADNTDDNNKIKTIEMATAALMIEVGLADEHISSEERDTIKKLLVNTFALEETEIDALIDAAKAEVNHAVSLYEFTRLIMDTLDITQRIKIVENLWRVAYADSVVDKYEEYYIRKIADLIYVPHADYIKAKLAAAD